MTSIHQVASEREPAPESEARAAWRAAQALGCGWYDGLHGEGEDEITAVKDLLADLIHLCDALDLDFDNQVSDARRAVEQEIGDWHPDLTSSTLEV